MKKNIIVILSVILLLIMYCSSSTDNSTQYPDVTITQPMVGDTLTQPTNWIKAEVSSNKNIQYVNFIINGEVLYSDSTQPYEYNWSDFYWADGNVHSVEVTAYDIDNIPGSDNISVTVSEEAKFYPKLLEPEDEDSLEVQNPIDFTWESLPDACSYNVLIEKENDTITFIGTPSDTTYNLNLVDSTALLGSYNWKVKAQNEWTLWSEYSPPFHFILIDSQLN